MRQIKFRAWDTIENKMHEWDDLRDTGLFSDAIDGKDAMLMQFTGILDKNGKEIYEGDITQSYPILYKGEKPSVVRWRDIGARFEGIKEIVLGNIHENPELL